MAYEVLARKWRPKHFSDVIGQEHVTRTLKNAIESHRVAHAYLFVGPRGIGKTTLSRIFAKALNCSCGEDATATPCDQCTNCREIMAGTSLDVIEIDAASNNGVNNIRDIREDAQFAPSSSRYKVFIIDEVHMLSTGAFNALLKTLEEPPPHVKFIFATTEVDKLPATIISRCQRFDLRRIPTAMIVGALANICEKEGVKASEDALLAIARGAEGGMRDALSALDQIISFKGNDVTEADVLAVFGLVSRKQIEDLTTSILSGDMAGGLRIIDNLDQSGKDLRRLVVEMLEHFRNLIVRQQLGEEAGSILDVTPEQLKALDNEAKLADTARVLRIAEHFADLEGRIRYALSRRTIFETVFLRCCRAATTVSLDQVIKLLQNAEGNLPQSVSVSSASVSHSVAGAAVADMTDEPQKKSPDVEADLQQKPATESEQKSAPTPTPVPVSVTPASAPAAPVVPKLKLPRLTTSPQPVKPIVPKAPVPEESPKPAVVEAKNDAAVTAEVPAASNPFMAQGAEDFSSDDSPLKAAHEPAIKGAMKIFKGTIKNIRPPTPVYEPVSQSEPEDEYFDSAIEQETE